MPCLESVVKLGECTRNLCERVRQSLATQGRGIAQKFWLGPTRIDDKSVGLRVRPGRLPPGSRRKDRGQTTDPRLARATCPEHRVRIASPVLRFRQYKWLPSFRVKPYAQERRRRASRI